MTEVAKRNMEWIRDRKANDEAITSVRTKWGIGAEEWRWWKWNNYKGRPVSIQGPLDLGRKKKGCVVARL